LLLSCGQKKTRAAQTAKAISATRIQDVSMVFDPGRSSGLQIVPPPRLPVINYSGFMWYQSLLTALAQRYGFAPYSLFTAGPETGGTVIISVKGTRITESDKECKPKKTAAGNQY
jgi:hypothetical protein